MRHPSRVGALVLECGSAGLRSGAETPTGAKAAYARPELRSAYIEPRDETEEAIAAVWRELLGLDRVGVNDNFFDLGGHSLLATQVMTRVRETLGVHLPLDVLFDAPTVTGLAEAVAQRNGAGDAGQLDELLREIEALSAAEADTAFLHESQGT